MVFIATPITTATIETDASGSNLPAIILHRFQTMLAHYIGQTWNGSESLLNNKLGQLMRLRCLVLHQPTKLMNRPAVATGAPKSDVP